MTSAMDTPFIRVFHNGKPSFTIVFVAKPKTAHITAAVMPRTNLNQ